MPELPEVQVLKQYLDATSLHQRIEAVEVHSQQMLECLDARQLKEEFQGRTFESTRRHGKYLFVELDDGEWLVLHFGMTGDLQYYKKLDKEPEYDQILFRFANGYHLAYIMPRCGSATVWYRPGRADKLQPQSGSEPKSNQTPT